MATIRRIGRIQPRISLQFFQENPIIFRKLAKGDDVQVPDYVVSQIKNIKVVEIPKTVEPTVPIKKTKKYSETGFNLEEKLTSAED